MKEKKEAKIFHCIKLVKKTEASQCNHNVELGCILSNLFYTI